MTTELVDKQSGEITVAPIQMNLLKNTVCKDHSDDQVRFFLAFCKAKRLDPFSKEVYSIIRKGQQTFQMSIDTIRAKADETGERAGQHEYWCGPDGKWVDIWLPKNPPFAAKVVVTRKGCPDTYTGIAKWDEYKPEGTQDFMWNKMPSLMLSKVAEALALRKAFPGKLGGIYSTEEMAQAKRGKTNDDINTTAVPMPLPRIEPKSESMSPIDSSQIDRAEISDPINQPDAGESGPDVGGIELGDPPATYRTITAEQIGLLMAKAREAGVTEAKLDRGIETLFNKKSKKDLTNPELDKVLAMIKNKMIKRDSV